MEYLYHRYATELYLTYIYLDGLFKMLPLFLFIFNSKCMIKQVYVYLIKEKNCRKIKFDEFFALSK